MVALTVRKLFSEVCAAAALTPVSMATLMRNAGWGLVPDANNDPTTTPSLDSFMGDAGSITPLAGTIYIGHDQYVRNVAGAGPPRTYAGVPVTVGVKFLLEAFCRGIVDPEQVWIYSVGGENVAIVLEGI